MVETWEGSQQDCTAPLPDRPGASHKPADLKPQIRYRPPLQQGCRQVVPEARNDVSPEDPSPSPRMAGGVLRCSLNGHGTEVKAMSAPDKKSHTSSSASPSLHLPVSGKSITYLPGAEESA